MQDGDYAEDTVLETFLQLLAADRSKVIRRYGSLAFVVRLTGYRHNNCATVNV